MPSQDRGSPPCSSLADPTANTNQGGQAPGNLPPNHGPRLGKEEGETRILAGANVAPTSALSGQGLLSLLQEPPIFSFSGTGGIYFLCHFGGCLPCQRLFCRVKKDKKVVSRLFGGGREDCLVRERGLLRSAQPRAALPLWLQSVPSPLPLVPLPVGPRELPLTRTKTQLSWHVGNKADERSDQHRDCKTQRCSPRALFQGTWK